MINISISTYDVRKGDTLESVAAELGISSEELKRYHNSYCDLKELIGYDLKNVRSILIPSADKIAELKKNKTLVSRNNELPSKYLFENFYAKQYEVKEHFEKPDAENLIIDYTVSVNIREIKGRGFIAEVKSSGFKKNDETPDDKISQLSIASMESIYPVSFIIPAQGRINGFYDHKEIAKKFKDKRPDLEDFFVGEVSQIYFDKFQNCLKDENFLLNQFRSTMMYQVLFLKMDWLHKNKPWEEELYLIQNSFPVKCLLEAECDHENSEYIETTIHGNITDEYCLQELLKGVKFSECNDEPAVGEINFRYKTNKQTKHLLEAEFDIVLMNEGEIYNTYKLILIAKKEEKRIKKFSTLAE
ncbi:hypothetical protein GCM10023210_03520 [Chryseobacterium ginsengisoli]|uniref:LysM domain-containing protein n=1 Tax=Chryseobacterium ginsengisoli TaxID=363853 RepID=A0ABP9LX71_9FLAO